MKMLTNFTCLPHWCINWATEMINRSKSSLKSVEASGVSGILPHLVELSSVQCGDNHCVKLGNFRQINPNELELFQFTQSDNFCGILLLWKICFASNVFEVVEMNFHPKCSICLWELCWEIVGDPSHMPWVMSLINQVNPPVPRGVGINL